MSKSQRRRMQAQKPRVVKTPNPEYVEAMQGLRGSNAAQPHRNKARYNRTVKHRNKGWD